MTRHGLTLIEIVLAISILAGVIVACSTIVLSTSRLRNASREQLDELTAIRQALDVLRLDLLHAEAPQWSVHSSAQDSQSDRDATTSLRIATGHHLHGDPPGIHAVTWRYDSASRAVIRRVGDNDDAVERIVAIGMGPWTFTNIPELGPRLDIHAAHSENRSTSFETSPDVLMRMELLTWAGWR